MKASYKIKATPWYILKNDQINIPSYLAFLPYHIKTSSNGVRTHQALLNLKIIVIILKIFIILTFSTGAIDQKLYLY